MSASIAVPRSEPALLRRFFDLELLDNRYPSLHGLRFLAIASIVQYHVTLNFKYARGFAIDPSWSATSLDVFFGMDLFFVLSGFLIGSILLRSVESSGSANVRRFYLRRAFRTFPAYYAVLVALVIWVPMNATQRHHLWLEFFYLTNYGKPLIPGQLVMPWGWSLALEEQFYLTVPFFFLLLYRFRSDRARMTLIGGLWIAALAVRLGLYFTHPKWDEVARYNALYYPTHTRFDTLMIGIALAYVQHRWRGPIARWLESPLARALLALPAMVAVWFVMQPYLFGPAGLGLVQVLSWGTLTSIMYFSWTLLLLNGGDGWIQRALSAPLFRKVATLGYGVYLVHLPICEFVVARVAGWLLLRHAWPMVAVWPIAVLSLLGLSLVASYGLHVLVEKPFLRIRDRLAGWT